MRVTATIDTIAAARGEQDEHGKKIESQAREIDAEAATYEEARDALFEQIPEGWMIVGGIGVPDRADTYRPRR